MLEVVEVDGVEDERARTVESEGTVGFVGLHHKGTCPHARDGHRSRFAADAPGGVCAEVLEEAGDEGGGGRLAVGSAHGDAVGCVDEGGEHFAAAADGKPATDDEIGGARGCEFGIVRWNGGRDDELVDGGRDVRGGMSNGHGNAVLLQPARTGRGIKIATGDRAALGF